MLSWQGVLSEEYRFVARLIVRRFESVAELRRFEAAWDDLWLRSQATLPTSRAALVALWCDHFQKDRPFAAVAVEHDGQLVAALPLVQRKHKRCWVTSLPANQWTPGGDLLLEPSADPLIMLTLLEEARRLSWPLWWIDALPAQAPRWQSLLAACAEKGASYSLRRRYEIDLVAIDASWTAYLASRSKNHRHELRRKMRIAQEQGGAALQTYDDLGPAHLEPLLRQCFELERSGWKGSTGGAVLDVPAVWDFYVRQARQLAAWGEFRLVTLQVSGQSVAFEYGWLAKGVYCTPKVGYDERQAAMSPGQLLRRLLFERLYATREAVAVDFLGPASAATTRWATHRYEIARLLVAFEGAVSRGIVASDRHVWPLLRRMTGRGERPAPHTSCTIRPIACPPGQVADAMPVGG
jgi:CelD/BcsL family acetyltransferase involved in cellulose biosynthesis